MLRTIELYFLLFFTYAVLGWIKEVIKTLIDKRKFVNRGFLIGPYCPIYGYGVILLTILLKKYQSEQKKYQKSKKDYNSEVCFT